MEDSSSIFLRNRATGGDILLPELQIDTQPPSGGGKYK